MRQEQFAIQREELQQTAPLEERRIACAEEEAKCRIQLQQAQGDSERIQAKKEEWLLKMDLARCRKQLRDEGVSEDE
ncbi:hypothetical protein PI124_g12940 [Phytophthora idaei]|nr:hypothetical protein PI125_g11276 [Phytophthora idaei]KAG3149911.1 hypothetical protein PI126_g11793 [Phytophthora idaei]KAG3242215.1 hypothetical protein PI124_g12940 [Phytophthora idaei]